MKGNSFGGTLSVAELIEERATPTEKTPISLLEFERNYYYMVTIDTLL